MSRRIVTSDEVLSIPEGAEMVIPATAIITDRARETAAERSIQFRFGEPQAADRNGAGDVAASKSSSRNSPALKIPVRPIVVVASDHAGFELKEQLTHFIAQLGYATKDLGPSSADPVDYPDFAGAVAEAVASGEAWRGIVVDAAGIGSAIAANKTPGIRAALCVDRAAARSSREHNDANVLTLGARWLRPEEAREIVAVWLETAFAGGRHQRRIDKITQMEQTTAPATPRLVAGDVIDSIADEVLRRLTSEGLCALRGCSGEDGVCPGCDGLCGAACWEKACRVVSAGADRLATLGTVSGFPAEIARLIDHTLLRPEASLKQVLQLCAEARQYSFASVCVNACWVPLASRELNGTPVKVCTVVGFPLGATLASAKIFETEEAIRLGAQEIDMVMNVGALKSCEFERVEQDIRGVVEACHRAGAICKVILECTLLTDEEKVKACCFAQSAGADFVKTSTGFSSGGATAHDVELMRLAVGAGMGVKAAGGIRSYEDLKAMLSAGATRIGASASVKILQQAAGGNSGGAGQDAAAQPAAAASSRY
jgi:deoxyribose-phosphate aldolase